MLDHFKEIEIFMPNKENVGNLKFGKAPRQRGRPQLHNQMVFKTKRNTTKGILPKKFATLTLWGKIESEFIWLNMLLNFKIRLL